MQDVFLYFYRLVIIWLTRLDEKIKDRACLSLKNADIIYSEIIPLAKAIKAQMDIMTML